jgi:hypothetical protein
MNSWCICWIFTHIFTGILIFKGLTVRRLYKSFGVRGLSNGYSAMKYLILRIGLVTDKCYKLQNVTLFNCFYFTQHKHKHISHITQYFFKQCIKDGRCTCEIKSRIAMAKAEF